jgi:hypothetical protein
VLLIAECCQANDLFLSLHICLMHAGAILAAGIAATAAKLGAGSPDDGANGDGVLAAAGAAVAALPGAVEEVNREVLLPGLEAVAGDITTLAKGAEQQVG